MNLEDLKPLERFSRVAGDYSNYRPGYPENIIAILKNEFKLSETFVIADIGSGTGKLSKLFLDNGNFTYGVEPNQEMRKSAESIFHGNGKFISVNGRAENTTLENNCTDFIVCGQAFHWFDKQKTRIEFERILKKNGYVMLIWNKRDDTKEMMIGYEKLIREYCPDHKNIGYEIFEEKDLNIFFKPNPVRQFTLEYYQVFDFNELSGRLRSSSYSPAESSIAYKQLIAKLKELFDRYQQHGRIRFEYKTEMFVSRF
jgi:SAM-dependent methyltransferase